MDTDNFLNNLEWRGLLHDCTDIKGLTAQLDAGPVTLYCGFDPTAESLHVGNLIPLLTLLRFKNAGHRPLALVGGATGRIGDPSGKSAERTMQTADEVDAKAAKISQQLLRVLGTGAEAVNNLDWTRELSLLDFLRDIGKNFSVNAMLARDSVKSRLTGTGEGISFTEFSYMLLQGLDFLELNRAKGCLLQIGGSDQWGNMCSGLDLIRSKTGKQAFALTVPLLTTSDGKKFGKSERGAIWLDPEMTSPWDFFQFWLNTDDKDVVQFLKMFTFREHSEILEQEKATLERPHERSAQRMLAEDMTKLIHGEDALNVCKECAGVVFGKKPVSELSAESLGLLAKSLPLVSANGAPITLTQVLVRAGLEPSITRASGTVNAGAVTVNGVKITDPKATLYASAALHGRWILVRKGKKNFAIVELQ
ncbi:tyrosine--tRNA ligase [Nostoc sp. CHAB 5834]|nr:tyrosine--tRNA ligase [Nostoc sp. CHAB 5834]